MACAHIGLMTLALASYQDGDLERSCSLEALESGLLHDQAFYHVNL